MTRAPFRVLRGVGYRPITSVSGHRSAAEAGRSRPPGSPVTTSRTPSTPGPVVDERLPPAGPVSTVERQSLSSRNHSMETPPCA